MKKLFLLLASLFSGNAISQNNFNLDEVLKNEKQEIIVMKVYDFLNEKSKFGKKIEYLNSSQKTFLFIENLETQINNGGFNQFYWNSSGDYANETVDALIKIGAQKTVEIVRKANSEFNDGKVPKGQIERQVEFEIIEEKANEIWQKCDSQFYEYQDNLTELLIAFIITNKAEFEN